MVRKIIPTMILSIIFGANVFFVISSIISYRDCRTFGSTQFLNTEYRFPNSCYVKVNLLGSENDKRGIFYVRTDNWTNFTLFFGGTKQIEEDPTQTDVDVPISPADNRFN